ncbi:hypothetical protein L0244_35920, partial [bacterium]|nr:hypothetical protein [bacterium]
EDLLNELVNRVVTRRQPGLNFAMGQLSVIIRMLPEFLNEKHIEALIVALEYLIKETELPNKQDRGIRGRFSAAIPVNDLPEYRQLASELAYRLFVNISSKNGQILPILNEWKEICQKDSLPEVRRVWQQII